MKKRTGIASLPVILLLGGIIIEIGIAGAFLLVYLNNSLYGTRLANQALEAAHSGVNDAILRIIVDKDLTADSYELQVGNTQATVTIADNIVTSVGQAFTKQHRLVATLTVSSTTGLVAIESIQEIAQ